MTKNNPQYTLLIQQGKIGSAALHLLLFNDIYHITESLYTLLKTLQ